MSNILDKHIADIYKDNQRVNKTVRVDKHTALKLDKFLEYCKEVNGRRVSQNQLLTGIIKYFIHDYEARVVENPKEANQIVIGLVTNQ